MPECSSCGSSFDDAFKFCPHCGHAQPSLPVVHLRIDRPLFEEAALELQSIGEVRTPGWFCSKGFDRFLDSLGRGKDDKDIETIDLFVFRLRSLHPVKGEYTAFETKPFRMFNGYTDIPTRVLNSLVFGTDNWVKEVFSERQQAWADYNKYLLQNGWEASNGKSTIQDCPLELNYRPLPARGKSSLSDYVDAAGSSKDSLTVDGSLSCSRLLDAKVKKFRYKRPIDTV